MKKVSLLLTCCLAVAFGFAGQLSEPVKIAVLQDNYLDEVSGIVVSRSNKDLFWVHNDSGDGPFLYGIGRNGKCKAIYKLDGAKAVDWEDMAFGPDEHGQGQYLFMGDIGDNVRKRKQYCIYRVREPKLASGSGEPSKKDPLDPGKVTTYRFQYPDTSHNCETLLVHPITGDMYVVTKESTGLSEVYEFPRNGLGKFKKDEVQTLKKVGDLAMKGELIDEGLWKGSSKLITGGDISSNGRRVVFCTYNSIYMLRLPTGAASFDAIWKTKPKRVMPFPTMLQWESVCFGLNGKKIDFTSEGVGAPIYEAGVKD